MTIPAVIVVDDSEDDRYIARRLIGRAHVADRIVEVEDGDRLAALLDDRERFRAECGEPPPPMLILLDINMPRRNGFEVLADLSRRFDAGTSDPRWFVIMMFTSSDNAADRQRALQWDYVRDYLVKPLQIDAVLEVLGRHYPDIGGASAAV
jgi:CheY-like chemotaxis protein